MVVGLGLALTGLLLGALGPRLLVRASRPAVHPAVGLTAWIATPIVMLAAMVVGAAVLLSPDPAVPDGALGLTRVCLDALVHGGVLPWAHALRLLVAAVLLAAVGRVVVVGAVLARRDRRERRRQLALVRAVAATDGEVWWIDAPRPAAFSLAGRTPAVVASTGVNDLPAAQRDAVLAHERAHLNGHHHRALFLARTLGRALPCLPLAREATGAVPMLVELCADTAAARECGFDSLADALVAVPEHAVPAPGVGLGLRAGARLAWLRRRHDLRPRHGGRAARAVTALAATLPAVVTVSSGALAVLAICS